MDVLNYHMELYKDGFEVGHSIDQLVAYAKYLNGLSPDDENQILLYIVISNFIYLNSLQIGAYAKILEYYVWYNQNFL